MKIAAVGEWRTGHYQDKDGKTVYTNECLVFEHEFVESKGSNSSNNESNNQTQPADSAGAGFMNIPDNVDDSGLPFNF